MILSSPLDGSRGMSVPMTKGLTGCIYKSDRSHLIIRKGAGSHPAGAAPIRTHPVSSYYNVGMTTNSHAPKMVSYFQMAQSIWGARPNDAQAMGRPRDGDFGATHHPSSVVLASTKEPPPLALSALAAGQSARLWAVRPHVLSESAA